MKTKKITIGIIALSCLFLNGCATITQGSKQTVLFDTDPSGATCSISRTGEGVLYPNFETPASLEISKDKDELVVICNKEGYKETVIHSGSNLEGWTLGNLLIGGIIGVGIDAASGAMNEYPSQVVVPLRKE